MTHCWHSLEESGRERIDFSFADTGSLYVIFESLWSIAMQSNHDAKPNIVDTSFTFISPRVYPQYGTIHFGVLYE
jgi:hypothetical protein